MENFDSDDIRAFVAESYENINQVENDIVDLEKNSNNPETIVRVYRYLHTLKGNCGFLAFPKLEALAHAGESLLSGIRDGKINVNAEIADALLNIIDGIRQIINNIDNTQQEGENDYSGLIETLERFRSGNGGETNLSSATSSMSILSSDTIRVDVGLLDRMMNLVGELVLTRNQVLQFASGFDDTLFTGVSQKLNLISSELQEGIMKTRMQPISLIWQKLPRVVRDLANACGKQVQVEVTGAETELDRSLIEAIKDPITHIVRNCIDHGIETPEVRISRGKPIAGRLHLRAFHEGGKINIHIGDDGDGIAPERIKQKALELGLISVAGADSLSEQEVLNLIFLPGLSTSTQITNLSGRGVGMDVVKTNIERVNGTVQVYSQVGQGTTFKIKIPLTLAIIPALIIHSGNECFTIPQASIQELIRLESETAIQSIETLYNIPIFRLRGNILPLVYLNELLAIGMGRNPNPSLAPPVDGEELTIYIVVICVDDYYFGLVVDAIEDTQDIVVKPLGRQLKDVNVFAGATILGDGKVALIIDAIALANRAGVTPQIQQRLLKSVTSATSEEEKQEMILLFEGVANARMAILLDEANRLEEFPVEMIEMVGNQRVVQYRDEILSLIDLDTIFANSSSIPLAAETIQVVVVTLNQQYHYGLIVKQILDIVEEPLKMLGVPTRPGVKFLAVIQNQITEIIDIENVIHLANPYLEINPVSSHT